MATPDPRRLPPDPFDRAALARNAARAARLGVEGADFLLALATDDLVQRLEAVERRFERAIVLDPILAATVRRIDEAHNVGAAEAAGTEPDGRLPLAPESCDLIVSLMTLHVAADVPGTLAQIARALRPDGLFLASFPGGQTLGELRDAFLSAEAAGTGGASPRVFPFIDVRDGGALLQRAGLALPVADVDRLTVRYDTPLDLMRELRAMGMGNALAERSRRFLGRETLASVLQAYAGGATDPDGRIRATFDLVSLSGWKPHSSQQKPLAPGSATLKLKDALSRG